MSRRSSSRRALTSAAIVAAATLVAIVPAGAALAADNATVTDFDSFSLGDPVGQNGWNKQTSRTYDFEIVDDGGKALRLSNPTNVAADYSQMSQLYAPRLVEPAGESSTGASNDVFELNFAFESSTGALQPGLNISIAASGERSDGAQPQNRAGGLVNISHTDTSVLVWSTWPTSNPPLEWANVSYEVPANGLHSVRYVVEFVDGDSNDVASLWVNGTLVSSGLSSWEVYHDDYEATDKQSVQGPLFRINSTLPGAGGVGYDSGIYPADPASLDGEGLLIRSLSYATYRSTPAAPPAPSTEPAPETAGMDADAALASNTLTFEASGFDPFENVAATVYSTPYFGGWFRADINGNLVGSFTVPDSIGSGNHTLELAGQNGNVALAGFAFLAATGVDDSSALIAGGAGILLLVGGGMFWLRHSTRAQRR